MNTFPKPRRIFVQISILLTLPFLSALLYQVWGKFRQEDEHFPKFFLEGSENTDLQIYPFKQSATYMEILNNYFWEIPKLVKIQKKK